MITWGQTKNIQHAQLQLFYNGNLDLYILMYDNVGNIFCCSDEKIMAMMRKYATGKIEADIYPVYTIGKINCGNDEKRNSHCGENRA